MADLPAAAAAASPLERARALAAARYGAGAVLVPPADGLNPVLETLLGHRSVRAFLPAALPEGTLDWLVAAAQSAPTSSNLQTWSVIAVEDAARKDRLAALVGDQAAVREAPLLLVWLADLARLGALARSRQQPAEGLDYLDTWAMAVIDASLAAQNAVVAAASLGLGSVYIGAIRNQPEAVAAELGLPPGSSAVFGLCVGRPDPARPASVKPRLPAAAVLSREQHQATPAEAVAAYDGVLGGFYARQGLPASDWSAHALGRLATAADLKGRHRLRDALHDQGFALR